MVVLFFGLLGFVVLVYGGYPLVALLLSITSRWRLSIATTTHGEELPKVTLVIPAYNEEAVIERKLRNFLALDYPEDRLHVVVISDGSTDATVEIADSLRASLEPAQFERIRLIAREVRCGKSLALSEEVPHLESEIIVFSDANSFYRPDALRKLTFPFGILKLGSSAVA